MSHKNSFKAKDKVKRITRSSVSCSVMVYEVYTIHSVEGEWVKLKERMQDDYNWHSKNFELVGIK